MGPKLSLSSPSRKPPFSPSPPPSPLLVRCALSTCHVPCCSSSRCKVDSDTCPTVPWGDWSWWEGVGGHQGPPEVTWAQGPCREGKCTGPDSRTQEAGGSGALGPCARPGGRGRRVLGPHVHGQEARGHGKGHSWASGTPGPGSRWSWAHPSAMSPFPCVTLLRVLAHTRAAHPT